MPRMTGRTSVGDTVLDWAAEAPGFFPRVPVEWLGREHLVAELQRVVAQRAQLAAYEAELVLGLADLSPESDDPPPGSRGSRGSWGAAKPVPGVSEFFPAELAVVLNCGRGTAAKLAARAFTYRSRLPGTLGALEAGVLDEPRARALAEVCEHASPEVARQVEAEVLPEAAELSLRRVREKAAAALARVDAAGTDARREEAERSADVRVYPSPREGMSTVAVELPADEAAAVYDMANRLARMLKADGDERPIGQLRARMVADLVLRPWDTSRPSVTAQLHVWAALSAMAGVSTEAGEVNGLAITAGHVRELLRRLDALGVRPPEGGSVTVGVTDDDGALLAAATLEELRRLARRGCAVHPDTDCSCPVLERPAAVDRYSPSAGQDRFVRTRDRVCRFPNCGQRVGWADLDHVVPHACGGETDCANLCCLCRSHHRLKTFARGWRFEMADDGVLTVTTPSGVTRTTRPPAMRPPPADPDPEPYRSGDPGDGGGPGGSGEPGDGGDRPSARARPLSTRELIKRWKKPGPRDPDAPPGEDPAPF